MSHRRYLNYRLKANDLVFVEVGYRGPGDNYFDTVDGQKTIAEAIDDANRFAAGKLYVHPGGKAKYKARVVLHLHDGDKTHYVYTADPDHPRRVPRPKRLRISSKRYGRKRFYR